MAEFDYASWLERASVFTARWDRHPARVPSTPVCPDDEINQVEERLGRKLPDVAIQFFKKCGNSNGFVVSNQHGDFWLHGGAEWDVREIPWIVESRFEELASWHEEDQSRENGQEMAEFLRNSIPVLASGNGDYLALDLRDARRGALGMCCHDMEGWSFISPSFPEFLAEWERCCYPSLDWWYLKNFCDPEGVLRAGGQAAQELRDVLGGVE